MKIKIYHEDRPAESPGQWDDSVLKIYINGPKALVDVVLKAVRGAIGGWGGS